MESNVPSIQQSSRAFYMGRISQQQTDGKILQLSTFSLTKKRSGSQTRNQLIFRKKQSFDVNSMLTHGNQKEHHQNSSIGFRKLKSVFTSTYDLNSTLKMPFFTTLTSSGESSILERPQMLSILFPKFVTSFDLLFKAKDYNFSAKAFHKFCDNYTHTITIIKNQFGILFGGYTPLTWNQQFEQNGTFYKSDHKNETFIFSLTNIQIFYLTEKLKNKAICAFNSYGPTFGGGGDIQIQSSQIITVNFPSNFASKIKSQTPSATKIFGTKKKNFKIQDYQVYKVTLQQGLIKNDKRRRNINTLKDFKDYNLFNT